MNENRPCKKELLEWINIVSFAVDDVKLFLDTHPNCTEALEFFDEFKKQRVQALKAVSYTHLDVYKRQTYNLLLCCLSRLCICIGSTIRFLLYTKRCV